MPMPSSPTWHPIPESGSCQSAAFPVGVAVSGAFQDVQAGPNFQRGRLQDRVPARSWPQRERLAQVVTVALVDNFLGQVRLSQRDHDAAARLFTDGLTVARRAKDSFPTVISLYDLALARQAQGDLSGAAGQLAAGQLKEGLALAAEAGDETSAPYYLEVLAAVAGQQGNPQHAVRLLAAARSILEASGSGWLHAYVPRVPPDAAALTALRSPIGDAAFE
jgi:hypothetical protein